MPTLAQTAADMLDAGMTWWECLDEIRKAVLLEALTRSRGDQCKAARQLQMHRNTLGRQLDELDINVRPFRLLPKVAQSVRSHDVQEMRA